MRRMFGIALGVILCTSAGAYAQEATMLGTVTDESKAVMPGVTVTGAVPDVYPYYERAWLFVAPLQIAQGVQTKVMEAMAQRLAPETL